MRLCQKICPKFPRQVSSNRKGGWIQFTSSDLHLASSAHNTPFCRFVIRAHLRFVMWFHLVLQSHLRILAQSGHTGKQVRIYMSKVLHTHKHTHTHCRLDLLVLYVVCCGFSTVNWELRVRSIEQNTTKRAPIDISMEFIGGICVRGSVCLHVGICLTEESDIHTKHK